MAFARQTCRWEPSIWVMWVPRLRSYRQAGFMDRKWWISATKTGIYIYISRNSLYMGEWYGISGISNNCNDRNKHELTIWDGFVLKMWTLRPKFMAISMGVSAESIRNRHLGWALRRGQVLSFVSIHSDHQLSAKQAIFSQKCRDLQRFSMRFVAAL